MGGKGAGTEKFGRKALPAGFHAGACRERHAEGQGGAFRCEDGLHAVFGLVEKHGVGVQSEKAFLHFLSRKPAGIAVGLSVQRKKSRRGMVAEFGNTVG